MSDVVKWIAAKADGDPGKDVAAMLMRANKGGPTGGTWPKLGAHSFAPTIGGVVEIEIAAQHDWQSDPDIWLYRKKTTALLRRYMRWSLEAGRLPSLLGRELFRAKITAFTATTFEARVIFLHDVEKCLDRLTSFDRQVVARVLLQEYDHESAARILQCTRRTLERRLPELIDELSESLLRSDLLERLPETTENRDE
ncbi:MAG: hypothetical protein WBM24_05825 [Candidatus Sulfotelmatobacter sp.]